MEAARSSTILLKRSGVDVRLFPWLQEQSLLAHLLVERGETAEAARLLGAGAGAGQPGGSRPHPELGSGRGQLLLAQGDARGAMTEFLDYGALLLSHNIRGVSYG